MLGVILDLDETRLAIKQKKKIDHQLLIVEALLWILLDTVSTFKWDLDVPQ